VKTSPLDTLPDDLEALKALVRQQAVEIAQLSQHVSVLKKLVFGPRTEKLAPTPAEKFQGHLFLVPLIAEAERLQRERAESRATVELVREPSPMKPKARRKAFPEHLPRVKTVCSLKPEERICCGQPMAAMGSEVTRELERIEMSIVHEIVREKYCCRKCQEHVKVAPTPERVIAKGLLGTGFLAHVITERFGNHMPYHRLEKKYEAEGIEISRGVLCRSAIECAEKLLPVWEAMHKEVLQSAAIHTDDTPVVLQESSQGERATGRLWIYRSLEDDLLYDFTESRSRKGPVEVLGEYAGYLQADAFPGYDGFFAPRGRATEVGCFAHARRYFVKAQDSDPVLAQEALTRIRQLYAIERVAKEAGLGQEARRELRQSQAKPVLAELKAWMDLARTKVLDKSPLATAIDYACSNWAALNRYVEDGRLAIDNLAAERALRAVAVGRKNWMMIGNERGGEAAAILLSMVQTCKAHGIVPQTWLRDVLLRVEHEPDKRSLTPRHWKARFSAEVEGELARAERLLRQAVGVS